MPSTNASPRPIAPAGGATTSLLATASSNSFTSLRVDPMTEGGVDHDGDQRVRVLLHERRHRIVQLSEAGHGPALGGEVGTVDDDVMWHTARQSITPRDRIGGAASPSLWCSDARGRPVGLRWCHPLQPVRGLQPTTSATRGLPIDFIRTVNATNPHDNAWARLERNDDRRRPSSTRRSPTMPQRSGTQVRGARRAGAPLRRGPAGDGRRARRGQGRRLQGRVPHQQRDRRRRRAQLVASARRRTARC